MDNQEIVLKTDIKLDDSDIGRSYLFWIKGRPDHEQFSFSSTLENIPYKEKHDCSLKNKTEVLILSDPTESWHPLRGNFLVSKILAHKIMWVTTAWLHIIDKFSI
jgi:hypothetical protein